MTGHIHGGLYEMNCATDPDYSHTSDIAFVTPNTIGIDIWHRRLAYLNVDSILHCHNCSSRSGLWQGLTGGRAGKGSY
jgi:hypothetical protein